MRILIVVNDAPYGSEKVFNAMRMVMTLQKEHADVEVRVFLMGDAVTCALPDQSTPQGYYNLERMFRAVIRRGGQVKTCGTCTRARGIQGLEIVEGVEISTMSQLAQWLVESDKVLSF